MNEKVKKMARNSKAKPQIDHAKVMAKIDNKAPRLNPENYLKSRYILEDSMRLKIMDRENLELVQRLNIVYRLGGKVDCARPRVRLFKSKLTEIKENNRALIKENEKLLKEINSVEATYSTVELLRDWKRVEANIEHSAKFPLIWKKSNPAESKNRTHCFFEIELSETGENLGRIIFELYDDLAPLTCDNFSALCRGDNDEKLSYKGTPFDRIVPGYWCQGGDVTKFNGTGGTSIYGDKFKDENFTLQHGGPGVISMWSNGPDTNNSKFNITFKSLATMDGKRVVFGKVIRGLSNLYKSLQYLTMYIDRGNGVQEWKANKKGNRIEVWGVAEEGNVLKKIISRGLDPMNYKIHGTK